MKLLLVFLLFGCGHNKTYIAQDGMRCHGANSNYSCGLYLYACDDGKDRSCQTNVTVEE